MAARLTGDALLTAIDNQAWQAAHKADELHANPTKQVYAPLMEAAVVFWRELFAAVSDGRPLDPRQQQAVDYVATETRKAWSS